MSSVDTSGLSAQDESAAARLVYDEARLLDERRFEEWLQLFDEDGVYWVPSQPGQSSPGDALSVFFERKSLLAVRVNRLRQPSMHAQIPAPLPQHDVAIGLHVDVMLITAAGAAAADSLGNAVDVDDLRISGAGLCGIDDNVAARRDAG